MCLCKEMVMIAHKALVQCSCINFNSITLKATHKGRKSLKAQMSHRLTKSPDGIGKVIKSRRESKGEDLQFLWDQQNLPRCCSQAWDYSTRPVLVMTPVAMIICPDQSKLGKGRAYSGSQLQSVVMVVVSPNSRWEHHTRTRTADMLSAGPQLASSAV